MRLLTEIGTQASQNLRLVDESNNNFPFVLYYRPTQKSWYFDFEYQGFIVNGTKLVNSPNILRKYRNVIPFGLFCGTKDDYDPFFIDDFKGGRATLGLLTRAEVLNIEETLFNGS